MILYLYINEICVLNGIKWKEWAAGEKAVFGGYYDYRRKKYIRKRFFRVVWSICEGDLRWLNAVDLEEVWSKLGNMESKSNFQRGLDEQVWARDIRNEPRAVRS